MNGNGFERIDIATTRAQFGKLCDSPSSVAKGDFGICEKREARIGALYCVGSLNHGCLQSVRVAIRPNPLYRTAARRIQTFVPWIAERGNWLSGPGPPRWS